MSRRSSWHVGVPTVYYSVRHLRADLLQHLKARALAAGWTVEETLNRALAAGLDALDRPAAGIARRSAGTARIGR